MVIYKALSKKSPSQRIFVATLHQAVEDVNRGFVLTKDRLHQLKSLQDSSRMPDYLNCVREMEGYGGVVFPHCASDARKDGHVVPIVSFDAFRLEKAKMN